jgi:tetratricopeptide (TPR) repeat protein
MEGWVTFAHLLAYFLVLGSILNKEKMWLWFLRANVGAAVILAISSIDKATDIRFSGPLGNPIYIAVYFLFIFFFALFLWYKDVLAKNLTDWTAFKKNFVKILFFLYPLVAGLSLFVVYRTSRGALLGAVGGIFICAILVAIFEHEKKVMRQIAWGGILAVVAAVLIFISLRDSPVVQNNPTLKRLAEVSWSNINGQARQLIWPMALKGFKEKPILGWGQEGFNYVFNKYYDPRMYGQETWFDRAHNAPLDFLVAGGILGLLSYLSLFGSALFLLWRKKSVIDITERSLLTGLLAGYLFQAIFVFDNLVSYLMLFTTLALIHFRSVENEETKPTFRFFSNFVSNEEYQNYILIPAIIILSGVGLWLINIPGWRANQSLIQAISLTQAGRVSDGLIFFKKALAYKSLGDSEIREQLISYTPAVLKAETVDQKTKEEFLTLTFNEVEKQIARVPNDARYYILLGSLLNSLGQPEQALPYINKAIELSPLKQAMRFELVNSLYMLSRKDEALVEAKKTYDLEPNYEQAKSLYEAVLRGKTTK